MNIIARKESRNLHLHHHHHRCHEFQHRKEIFCLHQKVLGARKKRNLVTNEPSQTLEL